jgi:hypothetical protein
MRPRPRPALTPKSAFSGRTLWGRPLSALIEPRHRDLDLNLQRRVADRESFPSVSHSRLKRAMEMKPPVAPDGPLVLTRS